jgi:hypothetical protein
VFRVTVTLKGGESAGDIVVQREGDSAPVRLNAVGQCENVLATLAQFAALSLDPGARYAAAQERELPENPYLRWKGPIAEALPENPYLNWTKPAATALPDNPYRSGLYLEVNPYLRRMPPNPYRR